MNQIRLGLEACLDVSQYANPQLDCQKMSQIREEMMLTLPDQSKKLLTYEGVRDERA